MARKRKSARSYRRKKPMARTRTRYRTRVKRVYSRSRGGGGKAKQIIDGVLAGAVGSYAGNFLGGFGQPAAYIGIGWFRKNSTLSTLGGVQLGQMLGGMLGGGGGSGNGGFFQS